MTTAGSLVSWLVSTAVAIDDIRESRIASARAVLGAETWSWGGEVTSLLIELLSGWRVVETGRAYLGQRSPRRRWQYATDAKFDIPDVPLIATYVRGADPRVDDRDLPQPGSAAAWAHQPSLSPVRTARSIP